jgi:Tfp pilus assembly protein PilF
MELFREGLDHHRAGRLKQAEHTYRKVLEEHPRHAGAVHLLGLIAFQAGKIDLAVHHLQTAIKIDRFQAAFHADLGEVFRAKGLTTDAIAAYRSALALNPEDAMHLNRLGTLYQQTGELDLAEGCFQEALSARPEFAEAIRHLGEVLASRGELEQALELLQKSAQLDSGAAETYLALGECLYDLGKPLEAIACFQKAVRLRENFAAAHVQLGLARLSQGDFDNGWLELEWRTRCPGYVADTRPRWQGGSLDGRRILIHGEGTLGDVLQFARYLRVVARRGGETFFEVPEALLPLLSASGFEGLIAQGTTPPPCELQAPLLSLPHIMGTRPETVLAEIPYLAADPVLVDQWRKVLVGLPGLRVGICWQGNPAARGAAARAIRLADFAPLAAVPGVTLISLQRGDGLEQLQGLEGRFPLVDLGDAVDERHGPFMDTAAIMKSLDLVISCDSAVAHLAGGLGVPVWIALSAGTQWRWMHDRDDSPWYPTARLFRQTRLGQWSDVMARMADALVHLAAPRQ